MDIFQEFVVKSIKANNDYGITEVREFRDQCSGYFVKDDYLLIEDLVIKKKFEEIQLRFEGYLIPEFSEYLSVVLFKDQQNNLYAATVYDSNALEQDPQIIEIYKL